MKPNSISGVSCQVEDLDRTASFYEALGFRVGKREPDRLTCYVNWFWVAFTTQDGQGDDPTHRGSGIFLHVKVDDIDEFYEAVCAEGMEPDSEPHKAAAGGREFVLRDPDSYKLAFFAKK
jgi:catechol 2,3-dioxygenase-like lactoylglutathione lyase family enzyme